MFSYLTTEWGKGIFALHSATALGWRVKWILSPPGTVPCAFMRALPRARFFLVLLLLFDFLDGEGEVTFEVSGLFDFLVFELDCDIDGDGADT